MKKLIKTAAVFLMPIATFAQIDGPHSHDRDTVSYQVRELRLILHDLEDIYSWQTEDINNGRYVCEHSRELLYATIEELYIKLYQE